MNFKELLKVPSFSYFIFPLTNECNLHCEMCSTLNHIPISPTSPHPYRREKWEVSVRDIELFCERFKGYGESNIHRLTGSEVTMMPTDKLEAIIDVFTKYNRKLMMITNGYNLLGLSGDHINRFRGIILDDHGINSKHIKKCVNYLKGFYGGHVKVLRHYIHYNLQEAMRHPSNKGKNCHSTMRDPMIVKNTVYPCCNMFPIEQISKNPEITSKLVKAGWTLNNPSIVETLRNWRTTLPQYVKDQCLYNCWRPNMRVGTQKRITLKPHDIIATKRKVSP